MTRVVLWAVALGMLGAASTVLAGQEESRPTPQAIERHQPEAVEPPPAPPAPVAPPNESGAVEVPRHSGDAGNLGEAARAEQRARVPRSAGGDRQRGAAPRVRQPREAGDDGQRSRGGERRRARDGEDKEPAGSAVERQTPPPTPAADGNDGRSTRRRPPYSRPRDDRYATGTAVPRGSVRPPFIARPGYYLPRSSYPWGWGPWGAGFFWYDPWWATGAPYYSPYAYGYGSQYSDVGAVRLKIKPREAQVFVDGYYVGIVDEFDGVFQRLRLEEGPHRLELKLAGYETQIFDVRVTIDHTVTLQGVLQPAVP